MRLEFLLLGGALFAAPLYAIAQDGTALIKRVQTLNGKVDGSIQQMVAENVTLNGGAEITGDLLLPGTPEIRLNGNPVYGGTLDGTGSASPSNHRVMLNGGARLRHVIRRTDPVSLLAVAPPPSPAGTRNVALNSAGQSPGDFATVGNLTLNGNYGPLAVPPGTYGEFTANGGNRFVLGIVGSTTTANYNFQRLVLNGSSRIEVVGPVRITLATGLSANGNLGESGQSRWLQLDLADGGLTLNGHASLHGYVSVPSGEVVLNGSSQLIGGLIADRLTVNGNGLVRLIKPPAAPPPFPDNDRDGMDDAWETANGLNPGLDDAAGDLDRDGLTNLVEFQRGLKPNNPDTDGDGLYDGDEIALGLDPKIVTPDTQPPTAPPNLTASGVAADRVALSWQPATDNLGVSGYIVYRDGQPIATDQPIRGTTFTDTNLPGGEEFTYQVRAFDFAGNLSPPGPEIVVTTLPDDTDADGLPDEWELKYFGEDPALPDGDADGDGLTNLQEFHAGSNPLDFYNGVRPTTITLDTGGAGSNSELSMKVLKPDGTPWINAPVNFDSSSSRRKIGSSPVGPFLVFQLKVRTGADGIARCYLEPISP